MFTFTKTKKKKKAEPLFKQEAYIPKSKLQKKERTISARPSRYGAEGEKPSKSLLRKLVVIFLWAAFAAELVYVVLFAGFLAIHNVHIDIARENNASQLSDTQIQNFVESAWQGSWYELVPKNNLLLLRTAYQERRLLERYPKLASAHITKEFPQTLKIAVAEKPYQMLWCSQENCFLVNEQGKAAAAGVFFQYPDEQGPVTRIQDMAEAPVSAGTTVLAAEDLQFLRGFLADFTLRTGLTVAGSLERPSLYAKELRVHTEQGFAIFFNTAIPVSESLNTLMLVLDKEIPQNEWDKIDYVDLRTENRVYYTRRDRAPEKTEAQKQREEEQEKKRQEEEKNNESQ